MTGALVPSSLALKPPHLTFDLSLPSRRKKANDALAGGVYSPTRYMDRAFPGLPCQNPTLQSPGKNQTHLSIGQKREPRDLLRVWPGHRIVYPSILSKTSKQKASSFGARYTRAHAHTKHTRMCIHPNIFFRHPARRNIIHPRPTTANGGDLDIAPLVSPPAGIFPSNPFQGQLRHCLGRDRRLRGETRIGFSIHITSLRAARAARERANAGKETVGDPSSAPTPPPPLGPRGKYGTVNVVSWTL